MELEKKEIIQDAVRNYVISQGSAYIPRFDLLTTDDKNHIINIGTHIICTRDGIDLMSGSFVQSMVNNDLKTAIATADHINQGALRFYVMMMYNMAY